MRATIKQFVQIVAESLPIPEPIYEFGSLQVTGQEGFADLRPLFPGRAYVGCDMRQGPGVDRILDLHAIDMPSESVGTILCLDTLEHVEYPHKAVSEIYRILRPRGLLVLSSVLNFPIHDYPSDYWRFTPEAIKSLLKSFSQTFVGHAGADKFPHTVIGIGIKAAQVDFSGLVVKYRTWQEGQEGIPTGPSPGAGRSLKEVLKSFVPPMLISLYRKIAKR